MAYTGNVKLINGLTQNNPESWFPIVDSKDVRVEDDKTLYQKLGDIDTSITTGVDTKIANAINELDVSDSSVTEKVVTSVSETDGKISVTHDTVLHGAISDWNSIFYDTDNIVYSSDSVPGTAAEIDADTLEGHKAEYFATASQLGNKQDLLTAGTGISINNNVISSSIDVDSKIDKVTTATSDDIAKFNSNGGLSDSGIKISTTIGTDDTTIPTSKAVNDSVTSKIESLDVADESVTGKVVTSVSETDGKISVTHDTVSHNAISDWNSIFSDTSSIIYSSDSSQEISYDSCDINADTLNGHSDSYFATSTDCSNKLSYAEDQILSSQQKATALNNLGIANIPPCPTSTSTNTFILTCTMSDGVPVYEWVENY